jgi:methylated-DNA-protein-cysteine methyltransferase related protein
MYNPPDPTHYNALVWEIARQIPEGHVSTYGQIASMIPPPPGVEEDQYRRLSARWVGSAMQSCPADVPWQRVINSQGSISLPKGSSSAEEQRIRLEMEGVTFNQSGRVDFEAVGWDGPSANWLSEKGLVPPRSLKKSPGSGSQLSLF